jgi:glycosyltransferase involved in cell wall biosynthesis
MPNDPSFLPYAIDPSRVTVIPNGIWIDEFSEKEHQIDYRAQMGIQDELVILFVGRLNPIKGPDILLEALKR